MPTAKAGRNDPCPCGSGKKYKNCCQEQHEQAARRGGDSSGRQVPAITTIDGRPVSPWGTFIGEIDEWNNAARDALEAGRHEEAERLAEQLAAKYPDQIDGYEIRGQVREAQGRWDAAAVAYEQALAAAQAQGPDAFDESVLEELRQALQRCRARAQENPPGPP